MQNTYKENVPHQNVTINDLPEEVMVFILSLIPPYQDLHACMLVSKKWRKCVLNVVQIRKRNFQKAINSSNLKWHHFNQTENKQNQSITRRHSHSAVVCDNFMYVFGGCSTAWTTFNDLWRLNLSTYEWTRLITMGTFPSPKACSSLVCYKHLLILFGGWTYPPSYPLYQHWHLFDELHVYDMEKNCWTDISVSEISPPPLAAHSVSVIGNRMVVFGGLVKPTSAVHCVKSNDVWILNLETWKWHLINVIGLKRPPGRFGQTQVILNDENVLILGGSGGPSKELSDCWILNMPKQGPWRWIEVPIEGKRHEPSDVWSNPGCKVGDKIVVLNRIVRSEVLYFSKNQWKYLPPSDNRSERIDSANRAPDLDENVNGRRGSFRTKRNALNANGPSPAVPELQAPDPLVLNNDQAQPGNAPRPSNHMAVHRKNKEDSHCLGLFVLDISKVLNTNHPVATWLPPKNTSEGPKERILYTLVEGKSELIMFGGIKEDHNSVDRLKNNISNTLHFFTAPAHVI